MDADYSAELRLLSEPPERELIHSTTRSSGERGSLFSLRLAGLSAAVGVARRSLRRWLERDGVAPYEAFEVVLACSEAIANAVEHPRAPARHAVEVDAKRERGELRVAVRDFGRWRDAPPPTGTRGRGLSLIRSLMDDVEIVSRDEGTLVVMRRSLRSVRPRPI